MCLSLSLYIYIYVYSKYVYMYTLCNSISLSDANDESDGARRLGRNLLFDDEIIRQPIFSQGLRFFAFRIRNQKGHFHKCTPSLGARAHTWVKDCLLEHISVTDFVIKTILQATMGAENVMTAKL